MTNKPVLKDLADYLECQIEAGVESVELPVRKRSPVIAAVTAVTAATSTTAVKTVTANTDSSLEQIARTVAACTLCRLHKERTRTVPGQGAAHPEILFVGEGPGADEDRQGLAFVGRAGQLLTKMIEAMGYTREQVFIANVVKCRPPDNRVPMPDEMEACLPYLKQQIQILKPKVIVALGATAVKGLVNPEIGITKLRGTWLTFEGIPLMPTYHPAYLLRNPPAKKEVWEDLKAVLKHLGKTPPPVKKSA